MRVRFVLLGFALSLFAGAASAQIDRASVSGTVTDATGAVVVGARITLKHVATGAVFETQTNDLGLYAAPALAVGAYEIAAELAGFKRGVRSGVVLRVADRAAVNFALELGDLVETVEVVGQAPLVESSNATVGKVLDNERIRNLPLNGRSALALVVLTPNVRSHSISPAGFGDRGVLVSAFSVNGGPAGRNYIAIDGANNINNRGADNNVNPAVDAIEEFKVESGTMSAEYGFTLGGVVNMVTKSGSNDFHGSVYEYLRNDALDARNTFAAVKAPFRYNQYGGSLGGPVIRNKTFFFFNFEQWNFRRQYTVLGTTPTAEQWRGDFSKLADARGTAIPIFDPDTTRERPGGGGFLRDPYPNNVIPTNRLDRVALNYAPFYPAPNRTPDNAFTNTNNVLLNLGALKDARQVTARGDHQFSDKNRFSVRYIFWQHLDDQGGTGEGYFPDTIGRVRNDDYRNINASVNDTHFFSSSLIHDFKFSVARQNFTFVPASVGTNPASGLGFPASVPDHTFPQVSFAGLPGIKTFPSGFGTIDGLLGFVTLQLQDNLTWIKGKHNLKFGVELRDNLYSLTGCFSCSGAISFNTRLTGNPQQLSGTGSGLASFLAGAAAGASVDSNVGVSYTAWSQAFFVQDDWKLHPRFTLNLGLRWDYQQWPVERHNGVTNFNINAINEENGLPGRLEFAGIDFGQTVHDPDYNDWNPRLGFAWDVTGKGKTVVRGGYGVYYSLQGTVRANRFDAKGFRGNVTTYVPPGGNADLPAFRLQEGFPFPVQLPIGAAIGPSAFQSQNQTLLEAGTRTPYSQQYTLTVQQAVPGNMLLEVGYVGNSGTKLDSGSYDWNQLDPRFLELGAALNERVANPYAGLVAGAFGGATIQRRQLLRPFPYYNAINVGVPLLGSSIYHGYIVNLERRYGNGLALLASLTFGKLLSGNHESFGFAGSEQVNILGQQNGKFDRRAERAVHSTDSAKRFVLSGGYELPFGPGKRFQASNSVLSRLIEGWQINGILTLQDGLPVRVFGANNQAADRPNSTGVSAKLPASERTRARWFDTDQFVNPAPFTYGNVSRLLPDVRGPGLAVLDFSAIKNTRLSERLRLEFRAEFFNFLNRTNLLNPNGSFSPGADGRNQSGSFGRVTSARDGRVGQLALRLAF